MDNIEDHAGHRQRSAVLRQSERNIEWILGHPGFSDWLKISLRTALTREAIAVANDLEILNHLLRAWTLARMDMDLPPGNISRWADGGFPNRPEEDS